MSTVKQPGPITNPEGEGIGATQLGCAVLSLARAAGSIPIMTVAEPLAIMPGPAGVQLASIQGLVVLVAVAAGFPPIITVGTPLTMVNGIGGCGMGVGVGAAG